MITNAVKFSLIEYTYYSNKSLLTCIPHSLWYSFVTDTHLLQSLPHYR